MANYIKISMLLLWQTLLALHYNTRYCSALMIEVNYYHSLSE
jgi:hypothetical protein